MTFLLHGKKEHEISQAFAKAENLWVHFEKEQDIEQTMEGMLFNWKCMGLSGSIFTIVAKISPAYSSFIPWMGMPLASAKVLLWGRHNEEEDRLTTADHKGFDKVGLLFLATEPFHNNFLWMFRPQEFLVQEADAFQEEKSLSMGWEAKIVWLHSLDLPLVSCASWAS